MAEISFTNAAVTDLSEIDEFSLAQFGEEAGEAYIRGFDKAFALLQDHPHAGSATPEYGKSYRRLVYQKHRIFYRVETGSVVIVRILRAARDVMVTLKKAEE